MSANICDKAFKAIQKGVERGDAVVEMEILGLQQRTINALEDSAFQIITLEQLLNRTTQELNMMPNIGHTALVQIFDCLNRYHELDALLEQEEWD